MRGLLDINVLIALLDENHTHHTAASDWLAGNIHQGWASCPLTQNGCVRIMSQSRYPNALSVSEVMIRLLSAVSTRHHEFFADDISLLDDAAVDRERIISPRQLTDVYLLALAVEHDARLVTLDKSIPMAAVRHAQAGSLVVI